MPTAMIETKALRSGHKGARTLLLGLAIALCGAVATPAAAEMTPSAAAPKRFVIDLTLKLSADSLKLTSMRAAAPSTLAPATVPPLTTLAAPISRYDDPTPSRSSASPSILGGLKTITNGGAWPTETTQAGQDAGLIDRSPAAPPIPFSEFTREIAIKAQAAGGVAAELYAARNHTPIWLRPTRYGRVRAEAAAAVASTLINADRHGAPLERYDATALMEAAARAEAVRDWEMSPEELAALELRFTAALLTYSRDMGAGMVAPRRVDSKIDRKRPAIALKDRFTAVAEASDRSMVPSDQRVAAANGVWDVALTLDGSSVSEALEALAPNSPDYRALMAQLEIARARADALDNAPLVKVKGRVETGDADPSVPAVRRRLALLGHLPPSANQASELYDAALAEAVHKFQALNGLQVDGLIGAQTAKALNLSGTERVARLVVNLERARWMNFPLGARHIRVNLPDLHAELIDNGETLLRTRAVIGKRGEQETPEFSDKMEYLVVNPSWYVPRSIAAGRLLEALQEDPGALATQNMVLSDAEGFEVDPWMVDWSMVTPRNFNFRIRQRPGGDNALGDVKFMFPNAHAVYLHDTSQPHLFNRSARALSHGCVRVADPSLLAEKLLSPQIAEAAAFYEDLRDSASDDRHVWLDTPLPVHIVYRTAWVDGDGQLQTRPDIYRRDMKMLRALRKAGLL